MHIKRRCLVFGNVQGVFFRASTRQQMQLLGVQGGAVNLADGSVEVLVSGEQERVEALCKWLWHGPPSARVDDVRCGTLP